MRIAALALRRPERIVSNQEVVDTIAATTKGFDGNLERTLKLVGRMLRTTGAETRRWRTEGESSLEMTVQACKDSLAQLDSDGEIDLLIVASVYAELIEPATSNVLAHELGLESVECLDLKEACDGWAKAMKVSDALIRTGVYKRIMIVNPEFSMTPGYALYPQLFDLGSPNQLEHRLPAYTIGEGVAVTIVEKSEDVWTFTNQTRNDLYDLCSVTPAWYTAGAIPSAKVGVDGAGSFTSWSLKLSGEGIPLAVDTFKKSGINPNEVEILFTHGSSKKDWADIAEHIGLSEQIYDIYATCGNLVSGSVPAAMVLALHEGKLSRGMSVAVLVASAGMSFSTASFVF